MMVFIANLRILTDVGSSKLWQCVFKASEVPQSEWIVVIWNREGGRKGIYRRKGERRD